MQVNAGWIRDRKCCRCRVRELRKCLCLRWIANSGRRGDTLLCVAILRLPRRREFLRKGALLERLTAIQRTNWSGLIFPMICIRLIASDILGRVSRSGEEAIAALAARANEAASVLCAIRHAHGEASPA